MNALSESSNLGLALQPRDMSGRVGSAVLRLCGVAYEMVLEIWDTVSGVLAMPLRHPPQDRALERLGDQLLNDIGYARCAGSKPEFILSAAPNSQAPPSAGGSTAA